MNSALVCGFAAALAFAVSCADSTTPTGDDDDMGSDMTSQNVCGDAVCAAAEVGYCMADCGGGGNNNAATCGNGMCETTKGESATSCAVDCGGQGSGSDSGSGSGSSTSCPADPTECLLCALIDPSLCPAGMDPNSCIACIGGGGGGDIGCDGGAPDGVCDAAAGEDNTFCPTDCP
jgi:hypothetical protein